MATVLVIDDDRVFRRIVRQILERAGHGALEAENGLRGLSVIAANSVDLVITDIFMPESDGIETLRAIQQSRPDLPVVATSAIDRGPWTKYLEAARKLGARDILPKPVQAAMLLDIVARHASARRAHP